MKYFTKNLFFLLITMSFVLVSCSSDDDGYSAPVDPVDPEPTELNSKSYNLGTVGASGISGTARFIEKSDATLSIELKLENTVEGDAHPAHVHFNTAVEGGDVAVSLETVIGATGESTTTFTTLDDGTPITYAELLDFNGYINIHLSATETATLIAQGDVGQNELTGNKMSYELAEKDVEGVNGTIEFAERVNETTLVTINLLGTSDGGLHPAHIHENDMATTGDIIVGLNPVIGDTGVSKTQVASLVSGASITYTEFLTLNAYVNIHLSDADLATIVVQGNIGSNTGNNSGSTEAKTYDVTNAGSSAYVFNGEGLSEASNPDFTFKRGSTYTFNLNVSGHPFLIKSVKGTSTTNQYDSGVTNNGAVAGSITFKVPLDAPNTLYYNCQFHGSMTGTLTIID
jgi:Cu/Zn superoxide dismutase